MKLPASSNSSTGGAAIAFWSLRTVLGRCKIQALPSLSIDTLETWPHTHLPGSVGQDGSTSNFGIIRGGVREVWAAAGDAHPPIPQAAMRTPAANAVRNRVVACIGTSLGAFSR